MTVFRESGRMDDWKRQVKTFTLRRAILAIIENNDRLPRDEIFGVLHNSWKLPYSREQFDQEFDRLLKEGTLEKEGTGHTITTPGDDDEGEEK